MTQCAVRRPSVAPSSFEKRKCMPPWTRAALISRNISCTDPYAWLVVSGTVLVQVNATRGVP